MKKKNILFYSSVKKIEFFYTQKFYQIDIQILEALGFNVIVTNRKRDFIKFWNYDIAFCYFYKWSFIPAFISRLCFKKVFFTGGIDDLSCAETSDKYRKQKILFKICYFLSTKCFIVSNTDMANVSKLIKSDKKVVKSFHTIDVDLYHKNSAQMREKNFFTIAWMNNIENVKRKGLDRALLLFSELIKDDSFKKSKFYIAGTEGDGSCYLRNIVKEKELEDSVYFLGNISDDKKIEIENKTEYYFQLSEYEGFGLAAIEALAAGCIVIHSNRGGLSDGIANNGVIVDIEKSSHIQKEELLVSLKSFDKEMISLGYQRLKDNFSLERRMEDFSIIKK